MLIHLLIKQQKKVGQAFIVKTIPVRVSLLRIIRRSTKVKDVSYENLIKNTTDTKMVYLLMSLVLLAGLLFNSWGVVLFVVIMLQVGVWTGFCPSKWFFGKCGFKKADL